MKQAHSASIKSLLADDWIQAFIDDLDDVHKENE